MNKQSSIDGSRVSKGFTLIEMMIVVLIVAVIAAIAVPSFNDFIVKNRVKSATEEIYGLLVTAKRESPVRDANLSVTIDDSASWCVGVAVGACDCTDTSSCVLDVAGTDVTQILSGTDFNNITVSENFTDSLVTFNRVRGTANGGTIGVSSGDWGLNIVVSNQGRIRICNPNGNVMTGYEACP